MYIHIYIICYNIYYITYIIYITYVYNICVYFIYIYKFSFFHSLLMFTTQHPIGMIVKKLRD